MATLPPRARLALPLAVALLLATMGSFVCQETALSDYVADQNSPPPADAEYLFTQAAANATVQLLNDTSCNLLITFNGAQQYTTWFTDRPNRLAGWMSTRDFVDDFDGYFDGSVPNAVIYTPGLLRSQPADGSVAAETADEDVPVSVPVTLCSSEYDPESETLSYTARLLSFYPPGIGSPALGNLTLTDIDISALAGDLESATMQTPGIYIDGVVAWETKFCFSADANVTEPVRLTTSIEDAAQWKSNKILRSKRADPQSEINGRVVQPNETFCTSLFVDKQHAQPEGKVGATGVWFDITVTGTVTNNVYQAAKLGYYGWERNCESSFDLRTSACSDPYTAKPIECPIMGDTIDTSAVCAGGPQTDPVIISGFTYQWTSASCKSANIKAIFKWTGVAIAVLGITIFTGGLASVGYGVAAASAAAAGVTSIAVGASTAGVVDVIILGATGAAYGVVGGAVGGSIWGTAAHKLNQCS